jgi:uncharacterized membrane protein
MAKITGSAVNISIFKHGVIGYLLFFLMIILSKLFSKIMFGQIIIIEIQDFAIPLIGFLLVVIVKTIEKFSNINEL